MGCAFSFLVRLFNYYNKMTFFSHELAQYCQDEEFRIVKYNIFIFISSTNIHVLRYNIIYDV